MIGIASTIYSKICDCLNGVALTCAHKVRKIMSLLQLLESYALRVKSKVLAEASRPLGSLEQF